MMNMKSAGWRMKREQNVMSNSGGKDEMNDIKVCLYPENVFVKPFLDNLTFIVIRKSRQALVDFM